jgi:hypothetical protein
MFDPNIIANIGKQDRVGDTITKAYTLRELMNQEQLQKMTLGEEKQKLAQQATVKKLASQYDLSTPQGIREFSSALSKAGLPGEAMGMLKQSQEIESGDLKNQIDKLTLADQQMGSIANTIDPILTTSRNMLAQGKSPAEVNAFIAGQVPGAVQGIVKNPNITPDQKQALLARVKQGPITYDDLFSMEDRTKEGRARIQASLSDLKGRTDATKAKALQSIAAQGGKPPAGYEWDPAHPGNLIPIPGGPHDINAQAGGLLQGDALDLAASEYRLTGKIPPLGRGETGAMNRVRVIQQAAAQAKAAGEDSQATIIGQAAFKASQGAYTAIKKSQTMVGNYEKTALSNMQIALDASKAVDRTGSPLLNKWILSGRKSLAGDPAVSRLDTAITTVAEEYAKVMTGATGSSAATDSARKTAHDMINSAQTPEQLETVLNTMKQEMQNRMNSYDQQLQELKGSMGMKDTTQPQQNYPTATNSKTGQKMIYKDGQWQPQ